MGLIGRAHLAAVPDPAPSEPVGGGLDGGTGAELTAFADGRTWDDDAIGGGLNTDSVDELRARYDLLLGVVVQRELRELADRYRAGQLTDSERQRLTRYARRWWADKAATPEHLDAAVDRAREIARGEHA